MSITFDRLELNVGQFILRQTLFRNLKALQDPRKYGIEKHKIDGTTNGNVEAKWIFGLR